MANVHKFYPQSAGQMERITRAQVDLAANAVVHKGRPAVIDGGYYREPAAGVAMLSTVRGRFTQDLDNTGGTAGAKRVEVDFYHEFQVVWLKNDETTPVAKTDRGKPCFWSGPLIVTVTDNSGANATAGEVFDLTHDGKYVAVKLEA